MPKGYQNDAQMDAQIDEFSYFFEKGGNARNYLFYNRKRGSGHLKMHEKSIQNQCKIDTRKSFAKVWKIIPKCIQNGNQNPSKISKIPEKTVSEN